MKTVTFTWPHPVDDRGYNCSQLGDQSGEYIRVEDAKKFIVVLNKFIDWNKKYPSGRIYSETEIRKIARELDAINDKAIEAISNTDES